MGLRDLYLESCYETESSKEHLLEKFYIPVLKATKRYYRIAGFFSSTALTVAAEGIEGLCQNHGHMYLLVSPQLSRKDFEIIQKHQPLDEHADLFQELKLDEAANALKQIAKSGRRVLFVATKKQAKEIVAEKIAAIGMPYVTERWAGGMLTNFPTIRKAVKKMSTIDKMTNDGTFDNFSKREKLQIARQRAKLEKNLGSIADLTRLPAALFVVDVQKESNAVKEAKRLNIPVFAMVDTCCDPTDIDYVIPANDDATKSIAVILDAVCGAISEGLEERKLEKEKEAQENEAHEGDAPAKKDAKPRIKKAVKASVDAEEAAVAEVVAATEQKAE